MPAVQADGRSLRFGWWPALAIVLGMSCASAWAIAPRRIEPDSETRPDTARFDGWASVRIKVNSRAQLESVVAMGAHPLSCVTGVGASDFLVPPHSLATLKASGIEFAVLVDDIQPRIDESVTRMQRQAALHAAGLDPNDGTWFSDYKTWPQVNAYLDTLVALRPDLASKFTVGTTVQGRTIYGIRITGPGATSNRPAVLLDGCQHAREWIAVMVPMYIADALVRGYDVDPTIRAVVDTVEIVVVPIVNPDGYEFTYSPGGNRLWRKNRRDNGNGTIGVDLNRNWGFAWGGPYSTSTDPASDIYIGQAAFSEPETQAVRDLVLNHPRLKAHIDFHSYGQLILQNWMNDFALPPQNRLLDAVCTDMNESLHSANGANYANGWGGTLLYLASGIMPDWCFGAHGIMSYTVEVRDDGQYGFLLPAEQIIPTCTESLQAALRLCEWVNRGAAFFFPRGAPAVVEFGRPTAVDLQIAPVAGESLWSGTAALRSRIGPTGSFASTPMSYAGGNMYQALLPATPCDATLQYYFEIQSAGGATFRWPDTAPALPQLARSVQTAVQFDFESHGWTSGTAGAVEGLFQRGAPLIEPTWPYDPESDADGSGRCWLTGNQPGHVDLDGGSAWLMSPTIDMTSAGGCGDLVISYAYFLHLTSVGNDSLSVEINSNDGAGVWTEIAQHATSGGSQWRRHAIDQFTLQSLGVLLTSTMRLRFVATDGGPNTIVEAAIDDVRISRASVGAIPACFGDIAPAGGDGVINIDDLLLVINQWNSMGGVADINHDNIVNIDDLLAIINVWGSCP